MIKQGLKRWAGQLTDTNFGAITTKGLKAFQLTSGMYPSLFTSKGTLRLSEPTTRGMALNQRDYLPYLLTLKENLAKLIASANKDKKNKPT